MLQISVLPIELRFTLSACARLQLVPRISSAFSTQAPLLKRKTPASPQKYTRSRKDDTVASVPKSSTPQKIAVQNPESAASSPASRSTQLIPSPKAPTSVDRERKVELPVRVLPKAQLSPDLTLTPRERLQLEWLTRTHPKREAKKGGFRERLLIYHGGLGYQNAIVFFKTFTFVTFFTSLCVLAPAYYFHGSPLIGVAAILLLGTSPMILYYYMTRSFVTWIYLPLPDYARHSPMAALKYARNLPGTAKLNINFIRGTALPGNVDVTISNLAPATSGWFPRTFEWYGKSVDKGSWYRPNPTQFSVGPVYAKGRAKRDVVPGIWEHVYKRIMNIESESSARWKK